MIKKLLAIFLFIFLIQSESVNAQFFQHAYGDRMDRTGVYFHSVNDGYVIVGTALDSTYNTRGYYILKVDKHGVKVWEKQYADAFSAYAYGMAVMDNGNIAIVGTHAGIIYSALAEVVILDSLGNFLTSQTYPPLDGWGSSGVGIEKTADSSLAITIYTDGFVASNYYSIYRLNQNLSTRWTEFIGYDGSLVNNHSMVRTNADDFFTLCYYDSYFFSPLPLFQVSGIRKFNSTGLVQLDSLFEFNVQTTSIAATSDGGCIVGGTNDNAGQNDIYLIKIDANGSVVWTNSFGSIFDEGTKQVIQTSQGGYALIATIPDLILQNQNDILFIRCDANGDSLCSKKVGSVLNEIPLHLEQTSDNNFAILGETSSYGSNQILLAIVDSMGNIPSQYNVLGNGKYLCSGDSLTLTLDPAPDSFSTVLWSNGDTAMSTVVNMTGNYFAVVTDSSGNAIESTSYSCFFATIPLVSLGADTIGICSRANLENSNIGDFTVHYQWYINDTLIPGENSIYFSPIRVGEYKLIASNYCSTDSDMVFVDTVYQNPDQPLLSVPPIDYVCEFDSLRMAALVDSTTQVQWFSADDFNWYIINGATDSVFYATNEGVYFVRITDANGCINYSDAKSVSYDHIPPLVNAGGPAAFCDGGEVRLSTAPGTNFLWSTMDTTSTLTVNYSGDFFVSYIDQYGCPKNTDTISITVLQNPFVTIGPDTVLCHDEIYLVDAGPGFNNYLWNFGTISQTVSVIATSPGVDTETVFVFVTDTNGCTNSDTAMVVFDVCAGIDHSLAINGNFLFPTLIHSGERVNVESDRLHNIILFFDATGKIILKKEFSGNLSEQIDFSSGIYFYVLNSDGIALSRGKLVVQKTY